MYKYKSITKNSKYDTSKKRPNKQNEEDSEEENNTEELVTVNDNHIYYYCDVNTKSILLLLKHIKDLNIKLLLLQTELNYKYNSSTNLYIYLHINSYGGYILDAFAGVDYIKKSKIPIISIVDGFAASAATFLSMVCYKRQITPSSTMLIHQLSSAVSGTFQQIDDDHINNQYLQNKIKKLYIEHSNGKLTDKLLDKILKHDIMWDAQKCRNNGIIDEIV